MQNESCPRRARRRKAHRRGSQQAGRIGRAKGKRRRSFCGLQRNRHKLRKALISYVYETTTLGSINHADPIAGRN